MKFNSKWRKFYFGTILEEYKRAKNISLCVCIHKHVGGAVQQNLWRPKTQCDRSNRKTVGLIWEVVGSQPLFFQQHLLTMLSKSHCMHCTCLRALLDLEISLAGTRCFSVIKRTSANYVFEVLKWYVDMSFLNCLQGFMSFVCMSFEVASV